MAPTLVRQNEKGTTVTELNTSRADQLEPPADQRLNHTGEVLTKIPGECMSIAYSLRLSSDCIHSHHNVLPITGSGCRAAL